MQQELFARAQREKMPASALPSRTNSASAATKATSPSACTKTARPGEIFIKMAKEGSTLSGIMDGFALSVSIGLQYGVPLKVFVDKLLNTRFEPSGITANPKIRFVSSVLDYIARWLGGRFISADYLKLNGAAMPETAAAAAAAPASVVAQALAALPVSNASSKPSNAHEGAPTCSECGMLMVPNGACYKCENCGSTSGCS